MVDLSEKCRRWAVNHKKELIARSGNKCERCRKPFNNSTRSPTIHHIRYEKKLDSVLYICRSCHVEIHRLWEEKGFLKRMIKWLDLFPENSLISDALPVARNRLLELKLDKDIPP